MTPSINASAAGLRLRPRVLLVDDEPELIELVRDLLERDGKCRLTIAHDLREARAMLAGEKIDLLLADLHLPDGDGMSLLPLLRKAQPSAAVVIMTGDPSVHRAVDALRAGVVDFLPKPFSADQLTQRVGDALKRQAMDVRNKLRLVRLRDAVKKLNVTRHTISKKVDLLCNDLVSAYGELSRQMDSVRLQENFRKLLAGADDLEQMLCHAMDWILRQAGYCNVAVWLAAEDEQYELGAYMKYTIAGEAPLTDAMRVGLVPKVIREGTIHVSGGELKDQLTPIEFSMLKGQDIAGVNCTYLGESLAALVLFRDEKSPFSETDIATLRAISPIFAIALANVVRKAQEDDAPEELGGNLLDDGEGPKSNKIDADWWKRGEPPPF